MTFREDLPKYVPSLHHICIFYETVATFVNIPRYKSQSNSLNLPGLKWILFECPVKGFNIDTDLDTNALIFLHIRERVFSLGYVAFSSLRHQACDRFWLKACHTALKVLCKSRWKPIKLICAISKLFIYLREKEEINKQKSVQNAFFIYYNSCTNFTLEK